MDAREAGRAAAREWDARYAGGPVWTREPNLWVRREAADLTLALGHAADAVAPGGRVVVVGHDARNPAEGVGGPQDPAVLTSTAAVARVLADRGLTIERAEVAARAVPGADRSALDTVVVASRPAGPGSRAE